MMRFSTLAWAALAAVIGFGLFQLKHEVQTLEDELFRLNRAILAEQEAIHVLRAEWSYINQPQRLQSLTARHLDLQPIKPGQIGLLADLPMRDPNGPMVASAPTPAAPPHGAKAAAAKPIAAPPRPVAGRPNVGVPALLPVQTAHHVLGPTERR